MIGARAKAMRSQRRRLSLLFVSLAGAWLAGGCSPETHVVGRSPIDAATSPPDSAAGEPPAIAAGPTCDPSPQAVAPLPVDLLIVLDASSPILVPTLWQDLRTAIVAFSAAPDDPDRRLGLLLHPASVPCSGDADCGTPLVAGACQAGGLCLADQMAGPATSCPVLRAQPCLPPATCRLRGTCSQSQLPCLQGLPCPGGQPGETCVARSFCAITNPAGCSGARGGLDVPVAPSARASVAIDTLMQVRTAAGAADLPSALETGYAALRLLGQANPARRAAVVVLVSTTGLGRASCLPAGEAGAITMARTAFASTPSITTHVVALQRSILVNAASALADAGGGESLEIPRSDAVATDLVPALTRITRAARACELPLAPALREVATASALSLWLQADGQRQTLTALTTADQCAAAGDEGWTLRPAQGGAPPLAVLCAASCARFRKDAASRIELGRNCPPAMN